ncbi:type VI secretion protein [Siccirubricoccus deserti]|uniref:Type VI secretion system baseplate subunit TssK n=1 Tax=Siccirubricoccus deserti TaxID=2013562 RepID=A0A9X0QUB1_9PROT|nr:type VI secretion system baseplate subunit TssK [Siccirubricoccus deserti]MBC4013746.1 type VI secretion system baseplate subunit TssK [Siccirubricoccus deserti]GGC29161.1 type VI secretion protein [Siccirubricoccus deserti]
MGWENKVVWTEGLFLQPQHLQQQDRYVERLVRASTAGLRPFAWGLTALDIDRDLLTLGKFATRAMSGILPDGTPFSAPGDLDSPKPIDLPESARNSVVYLVLPARQPGVTETAPAHVAETVARYASAEHEAVDTNAGYQSNATIPVAKLRLRFALEHEARQGMAEIGLARIVEVRSDKSVVLDENYIPPVLLSSASSVLSGFVTQVQGLVHHRGEALAGRVSETATRGAAEFADFLLLQLCNRTEPVLTHMAATLGQLHPETFYRYAVGLAGELATFTEARKRPAVYPPYRHEDLTATFRPVMAAIRQSLSAVLEQTAVPIPLQERKFGIRVAPIADHSLVTNATWVLVVTAQMPAETLRRNLPNQIKIGPVEQIRELINVALPGIAVRALPVAPRQLPYYSGASYFELDRSGPYWAALARSGGAALHLSGEFPGLNMECWAIRG